MTQTQAELDGSPLPAITTSPTRRRPPRRSNVTATLLAVGGYMVLAILANWNAWTTGAGQALQGSQDPKLDAWYVAWTPFALTHGVNPLYSHWVNVPYGANYAANVAIPLLTVMASPITAGWGPVAGVNFLISFSFFATCIAGYCFVRHWVSWRPAAFFGGLLFGFSPYMVAEGTAHLHPMFVALVPFIFILLDEILVRQRYSARLLGVGLGLLIVAQYFVSTEVLASSALLAILAAILVALFNLGAVRAHVIKALPAVGIAFGIAVVILVYPFLYSVSGPEHYTLVIPAGLVQSDLLSAVLPTSNQLIAPGSATTISSHFANNLSENGAYLGIPLVLFLLVSVVACRKSKVVVIAFLLALSAYVVSLGSPLFVGNQHTGIGLPGVIFSHIPLLQGAALARFSLYTFLFGALVFGVSLDRLRRWNGWPNARVGLPVALVATALALAPLVPALPYAEVRVDTPTFFTTTAVDSVPDGSVAVVYPPTTTSNADATLWQASAAMRFKMPGVYALVPTRGSSQGQWGTPTLTTTTLDAFGNSATVPETPVLRHALRAQWRTWKVQTVIVGPSPGEQSARQFMSWLLGHQPIATHGVYVWYRVGREIATA